MVEENKKMLKVENEVVKKPTAPAVPRRSPSKYYPGPTMLNFRDQTRTGVFIVVCSYRHDSLFCGCYCFATFRPICQESLDYCFVLCDGKGSREWLKKIKRCSK